MIKPEDVYSSLLSTDYIVENGVIYDTLSDEFYYDEKGIYHYDRKFDKSMNTGGKPFSGIAFEFFCNSDEIVGYTEYKDGYHYGDDVEYYLSGTLKKFSHYTDEEKYLYKWYENGKIEKIMERSRKDFPHFYRTKIFDESGELIKQSIHCEIDYTHDFNSPNSNYEVKWHEHGEFKLIRNISPTRNTFYLDMEFDENSYPVKYTINPNYSPEYLSPEKYVKSYNIKTFDKNFKFFDDKLYYLSEYSNEWIEYKGYLCFRNSKGWIERVMEFSKGIPQGSQCYYYKNGNLKESYCISKGKKYNKNIFWNENGRINKVVFYSVDKKRKHIVNFNDNGKIVDERDENV